MHRSFVVAGALALLLNLAPNTEASQVTYGFTTTVGEVGAALPPALAGVQLGDALELRVSFDYAATTIMPNPLSGNFQLGAFYALAAATVELDIGSLHLNTWAGTPVALLFNDQQTVAPANTGKFDGLLIFNLAGPGNLMFQVGDLLKPVSTFNGFALPQADLLQPHILQVMDNQTSALYVRGAGNPPLIFSVPSAVPVPASGALLLSGIAALVLRRTRRR